MKKNTIWIIGVLLVAAIASTWFILNNQSQEQDDLTVVTIIPPTDTPTDTPESEDAYNQVELMGQLIFSPEFESAISQILAENDTQFIPVFIELLRAKQIGLIPHLHVGYVIQTLEQLSGQPFGVDWAAWIEWYGGTDLTPPEGFTSWKGRLLGFIDPGFTEFLQDDHPSVIRVEEIVWGGVPVDGIPALDNPNMIQALEADYLEDGDPVFGISINGDNRAYPLRILDWHEMANDVIGGEPVSLAYCTLCGAGIAYHAIGPSGETYTFGSSGFLFRSNKLMYDRQTRTLWNQLTGEPVLGELVGSGIKLDFFPVVVTTWADWKKQHPDTIVLDIETGHFRPYEPGAAYGSYFASEDTMFPVWRRSELLDAKDRIYAIQVNGIPKAYPIDLLIEEVVVNDTVGEINLVLIAERGDIFVNNDTSLIYNAGAEVRAYDRGQNEFSAGPKEGTLLDGEGRIWEISEDGLIGPEGEIAPRVSGHLAYWFGWYSFFPKTLLYGES